MKISFVATVFNEEKTIEKLLDSLFKQSRLADEVVIVDGGSTDATTSIIRDSGSSTRMTRKRKVKIIIKKGNRAVGRNEAIRKASGDIIVCSDAGCILDKNWIKNITEPFRDKKIEVVAGYYKGIAKNIFQKCLIPYVLVMPDRVDLNNFMPASRSMAFKKKIWEKAGGFPENLSHNEDFAFAKKLKEIKAKIVFEKDAIVYWIPRKNIKEAFIMFFRFALGDAEARILRLKAAFIFVRYFLGFYLLFLSFIEKSYLLLNAVVLSIIIYIIWSVIKNYKYIKNYKALLFLPILQFTSDTAVLLGTIVGLFKRFNIVRIKNVLLNNKAISALIFSYAIIMILIINWGIPNINHPFPYHMDEWHQLQAVRAVFSHGTPNIEGAAHGPLFHFLISGVLLLPVVLLGIVNPFAILSSVTQLEIQEKLFIALRFETLFFGIMSIIVFTKIIKENIKVSPFWFVFFFVASPIWLSLSNYFKYDIALTFWILLSVFFVFRYIRNMNTKYFIISGIAIGIAVATKLTAIPLFFLLMFAFFFYTPSKDKSPGKLILGTSAFLGVFLLFGIPDLLVSGANYYDYLFSNLVTVPAETSNYYLFKPYYLFLIFDVYPKLFGHGFYHIFLLSFFYWMYKFINSFIKGNIYKYKVELFIYAALILFIFSLIPLKISATGNRVVVLLPFMVLISAFAMRDIYQKVQKNKHKYIHIFVAVFILIHIGESASWIALKLQPDPRIVSSLWIQNNIKKGSEIGIENIPIYQYLPDIILKEFYTYAQDSKPNVRYLYKIVNANTYILPKFIIITNYNTEMQYFKKSPKNDLVYRLQKEGYKERITFRHNKWYNITQEGLGFYLVSIVPVQDITIYTK